MLSDSTLLNDLGDKKKRYAQLGIAEYWIFAPPEFHIEDLPALQGFRLGRHGYEPIAPVAAQVKGYAADLYPSAVLGAAWGEDAQALLRLFSPLENDWCPLSREVRQLWWQAQQQLLEERARADREQARADREQTRADHAETQAARERTRAQQAETQAARERTRAQETMEENARLRRPCTNRIWSRLTSAQKMVPEARIKPQNDCLPLSRAKPFGGFAGQPFGPIHSGLAWEQRAVASRKRDCNDPLQSESLRWVSDTESRSRSPTNPRPRLGSPRPRLGRRFWPGQVT